MANYSYSQTYYSNDYEPQCELCKSGQHQQTHVQNIQQTQTQLISVSQPQVVHTTPERIVSQRILASPQIQQIQPIYQQQSYVQIQTPPPVVRQEVKRQEIVRQEPQRSVVTHVHNVDHVPVVHELHHVNRQVSVVTVEEIEGPWKSKVIKLEKQLLELELMVRKNANKSTIETKQVVVEDVSRIKNLEQEIRKLEQMLQDKEQELNQLDREFGGFEEEFETVQNSDDLVNESNREFEMWKKKFSDQNRQFHDIQQDLMMKQAELESLQKRQVTVTKSIVTQEIPGQSIRRSIHQSYQEGTRNSGYRS